MIELLVSIAAIWGAVLSTLLAIRTVWMNRPNLLFELEKTWVYGVPIPTYKSYHGFTVIMTIKNRGRDTTVNRITLNVKEFEHELETTEAEPWPIPEEPSELYVQTKDVGTKLFRGDSKSFQLYFLDEGIDKYLEKHKGLIKGVLTVYDTYKQREIDVSFQGNKKLILEQQ
jgi:hypothetical protein